jgi:tetratricopeptide (TPR) repeat protein
VRRIVLALLVLAACDGRRAPPGRDAELLSETLLVDLAQAKGYHHLADVYLAEGETDAAIGALSSILTIRFPAGAPEGEDTILDARARLAKLLLSLGRFADARRVVDEGLAAPSRESFFLANLYMVAGEIHEAQGKSLDTTDPTAARAERHAAIAAYDRSLQINQRVQERLWKETRP